MVINRKITEDLKALLEYFPVVAIVGPRQCGKTTLAKMIRKELTVSSHYLDLEWEDDLRRLSDASFYLDQYQNNLMILDEIQRLPSLFPLLRALVDRHSVPGRYLLLVSASPDLIRDTSESLAGRIAYIELSPFRLDEIVPVYDWKQLWLRGGFPKSFLAPSENLSEVWRRNFIQTYIERDIPLLGLKADPVILGKLIRMIAISHGNILNIENISRSISLNSATIKKYLSYLEQAFLITRLMPYTNNRGKRLVKSPKIYIRDTGIFHYLNRIQYYDTLWGHPLLGASWEGFVISQIQATAGDYFHYFFYRTQQGAEVDLILQKGDRIFAAIEIKYASVPKVSRGFYIAIEDLTPENRYIIIPGEENYQLTAEIRVHGLNYFLTEVLPGEMKK